MKLGGMLELYLRKARHLSEFSKWPPFQDGRHFTTPAPLIFWIAYISVTEVVGELKFCTWIEHLVLLRMSKKNFEAIFTVFALFAKNVIFSSNFQSAPISMKFDIWGISDMPQRLVAISCTGGDLYVSGNVN